MLSQITIGTILVRENVLLPTGIFAESDAFFPEWRVVRDLEGHGFATEVRKANWRLFYLAGETGAIALGREELGALRNALKRALANLTGHEFNTLEITNIISKRFLGVPFVSIAANARHIQQSNGLLAARNFVLKMPSITAAEKSAKTRSEAMTSSS